ncbi:IPT/TIG domain-containing protein [Chitinophaga nivalis]|uniref:IPT/TIG domain-containing protein n=1 Tax=Chitinophaga nivalis TaxID=2991709 RepID=A0ABT3IIZ8_9BACT|nr:IPT/TIG domain-containing protein [Chitinophaga nivalis]MCW3466378.1 IPT/TIG domain-containing protein [Chitinophaga nivalis]MCW3483931.1 IPT/TIG domain-containing protein [Chitinophaga nivalis]
MKRILQYPVWGLLFLLLLAATTGCRKKQDSDDTLVAKVLRYYPNSGKAGTLITIEGTGFGTDPGRYTAAISGVSAEVISATANAVVLRAPAKAITGPLTLQYQERSFNIGQYTYQALSVQRVTPLNGPAGSAINISGEGFGGTGKPASVFVNGKEAIVITASDTLLIAEVPADAGTGVVMVKVDGAVASGQEFTYQAITAIRPQTGGKNTKVTITGTGFDGLATGNVVTFNGKPAVVTEAGKQQLVVVAPEGVETGPLVVTIHEQKTVGPVFTVVPPPVINVVSPLSGPRGAEMTITGARYSSVKEENKVFLNGVEVAISAATEKELKLIIPGGTGNGIVKVVVNDQETSGPQFKDQALGITAVSPESGLAGTMVTITGTGFSNNPADNIVSFNGISTTVMTATETSLVLAAPAGLSTGELKVVVKGAAASAPRDFRRAGVMTLAGGPASNDLTTQISRIVVDDDKNVYVSNNTQVLKISSDSKSVTVLAGSATGAGGRKDGTGTEALFDYIRGMVIGKDGNIYVMDGGLRKITLAGKVTTVSTQFTGTSLTVDADGNLYATRGFDGFFRYNINGIIRVNANAFYEDCRPALDKAGNIYISKDQYESSVSFIAKGAMLGAYPRPLIGNAANPGYQDGPFATALLNYSLTALLTDNNNDLYILDGISYAIRKADLTAKEVSTVIKGEPGYEDGSFDKAKFAYGLSDMAIDKDGDIYVVDKGNKAIRKIFLK